jgi:FkbM family methyltransferase
MLDFARSLTVPSAVKYLSWRARGRAAPVVLRARGGARFELRPTQFGGLGNNDYGVAYEVFAHRIYSRALALDAQSVKCVADLGTNVGLSVLYWLSVFPNCNVIAYEPHPGHARQAARNFALTGVAHRVELHEAGAGSRPREAVMTDLGTGSSVQQSGEGLRIRIEDAFPTLLGRKIDLLKIDIEGGEYEIMGDPRFAEIGARAIIMEWHASDGRGLDWCRERLQALGYTVEVIDPGTEAGTLWAERR